MNHDDRQRSASRARARDALPLAASDRSDPDLACLGAAVRSLRLEHGFGTRTLAARAAVARSTIERLEGGQLRPRPSLLRAVAWGLNPDRAGEFAGLLFAAAGECVAAEGGWWQYRARRLQRGMTSGVVPLPRDVSRRVAAHRHAAEARSAAHALTSGLGWTGDQAAIARASDLFAEARRLDEVAGGLIRIGGVTYGL